MTRSKPTQIGEQRDVERMLIEERPVPRGGFRAELRLSLLQDRAATPPRHLSLLIAAYTGSGAVLILVAALGVGGVGPLGP